VHLPDCPANDVLYFDHNATINYLETCASIHTVRMHDVQFQWLNQYPQLFFTLDQSRNMPTEPPTCIAVYGSQKQHQQGVECPSIIFQNPLLPGSTEICLVKLMHQWVTQKPPRASLDFVFLGVHNTKMSDIIKTEAQAVGFDPKRTMLSGLRIACASASNPDVYNMDQECVNHLIQHHQQWKTTTGSAPYRIQQVDSGLIKTIQLYFLTTNSIEYV